LLLQLKQKDVKYPFVRFSKAGILISVKRCRCFVGLFCCCVGYFFKFCCGYQETNKACCLFMVEMLLLHKLMCRHCIKTEHTVMKRNVNKRAKSVLVYEPLSTNLLKSKEL